MNGNDFQPWIFLAICLAQNVVPANPHFDVDSVHYFTEDNNHG